MSDPVSLLSGLYGASESGPGAAAIRDFLQTGGQNLDPATTAWCAAIVNASLQQSGIRGTGSNMARSFMDWGEAVDQPRPGDIAVFSRGDPNGPYGHVGLFQGFGPDGKVQVLGGNQGDAVNVSGFDPSSLLGFRRATPDLRFGGEPMPDATQVRMPPPMLPQQDDGLAGLYAPKRPRPRDAGQEAQADGAARRRALFDTLPGL